MKIAILTLAIAGAFAISVSKQSRDAGYFYERGYIRTPDNNYLLYERIRNDGVSPRRESTTNRQIPVLLVHGLLVSSLYLRGRPTSSVSALATPFATTWPTGVWMCG